MNSLLDFVEPMLKLEGPLTERIVSDGLEVMIPPALQREMERWQEKRA